MLLSLYLLTARVRSMRNAGAKLFERDTSVPCATSRAPTAQRPRLDRDRSPSNSVRGSFFTFLLVAMRRTRCRTSSRWNPTPSWKLVGERIRRLRCAESRLGKSTHSIIIIYLSWIMRRLSTFTNNYYCELILWPGTADTYMTEADTVSCHCSLDQV